MHLIQILLPVRDRAGEPYAESLFPSINATLIEQFGGLTAYSRSPAKGTWVNAERQELDDVIVVEVMAKTLDRPWWQALRQRLEAEMGQAEIVVRTYAIERL